jgi:hypothetical protein
MGDLSMTHQERLEVRQQIAEILAWRHKLDHDERMFVNLMSKVLDGGRAVAPAEMVILDQIWEKAVRGEQR